MYKSLVGLCSALMETIKFYKIACGKGIINGNYFNMYTYRKGQVCQVMETSGRLELSLKQLSLGLALNF